MLQKWCLTIFVLFILIYSILTNTQTMVVLSFLKDIVTLVLLTSILLFRQDAIYRVVFFWDYLIYMSKKWSTVFYLLLNFDWNQTFLGYFPFSTLNFNGTVLLCWIINFVFVEDYLFIVACWSFGTFCLLDFLFVWINLANTFVFDRSETQSDSFRLLFTGLFIVSVRFYLSTYLGFKTSNIVLCLCPLTVVSSVAQPFVDLSDFLFDLLFITFPRLLLLDLSLHLLFPSILTIDLHWLKRSFGLSLFCLDIQFCFFISLVYFWDDAHTL